MTYSVISRQLRLQRRDSRGETRSGLAKGFRFPQAEAFRRMLSGSNELLAFLLCVWLSEQYRERIIQELSRHSLDIRDRPETVEFVSKIKSGCKKGVSKRARGMGVDAGQAHLQLYFRSEALNREPSAGLKEFCRGPRRSESFEDPLRVCDDRCRR